MTQCASTQPAQTALYSAQHIVPFGGYIYQVTVGSSRSWLAFMPLIRGEMAGCSSLPEDQRQVDPVIG